MRDSSQGQSNRVENRRKHVSAYCSLIIKEKRQDFVVLHARANENPRVHKGQVMVWVNVISCPVFMKNQMKNSSNIY